MHKLIFKIMLALTPGMVKQYFDRRIQSLRSEIEFLRDGVRSQFDAEGYRLHCSSYEELYELTKRQMAMRQRKLYAGKAVLPAHPRLRLPVIARLFRTVSKWLARLAKSLDHSAGTKKMHDPAAKPQMRLELEK